MTTPEYDIVLYGATGFTGGLAAQYLATHPQQPKVAFAGRNAEKLRKVRDNLTGVSKARLDSIALMEATSSDTASLARMARSAKVVMNMVGPYGLLGGFEVAKAVAEAGTGYVDLTGESDNFARVASELHSIAKSTHAVLVPSSGFDSLPFDLTSYLAAQELKKTSGPGVDVASVLCGYLVKGSVSGGTVASLAYMGNHPYAIKFSDLYWMSPLKGTAEPKIVSSRFLPQFGKYGSYSLFTPHNTRVVYRSWGLMEEAHSAQRYGSTFRYLEGFVLPSHIAAVIATTVFQVITWLTVTFSAFGKLCSWMVPQGTGGSMEVQLQGFADVRTVAYGSDGKSKALTLFKVKGDPGYLKTAAMISEAALTIALEKPRLSELAHQGGVLTPSTIGGEVLAERLVKYAGVRITSKDVTDVQDMRTVEE